MMTLAAVVMRFIWPRKLFARLTFNIVLALFAAHMLEGAISRYDQQNYADTAVGHFLAEDVVRAIALLDSLPPAERTNRLPQLQRKYYRFSLGDERFSPTPAASLEDFYARMLVGSVTRRLGPAHPLETAMPASKDEHVRFRVRLNDGSPLTVIVPVVPMPVFWLGGFIFMSQMVVVFVFIWIGSRQATVPLMRLAAAARRLGTSLKSEPLAETGTEEVAAAASAFNAMQKQIADHLAERTRILAAISHDLQTPITRMKLRAELLEDAEQRNKMLNDLGEMQALVAEGLAYARSTQSTEEPVQRTDIDAFLDSIACDYTDSGRPVALTGRIGGALDTRPHALRRILCNLLDNAFKFAGGAELHVETADAGRISIAVLDRGPGIPEEALEAVLQPFYRVETSRNRETGGTGLGLAIAQQLTNALGGRLVLSNREGGGLEARVLLPAGR